MSIGASCVRGLRLQTRTPSLRRLFLEPRISSGRAGQCWACATACSRPRAIKRLTSWLGPRLLARLTTEFIRVGRRKEPAMNDPSSHHRGHVAELPRETEGLPEARETETVELADGDEFELEIIPVKKRIGD